MSNSIKHCLICGAKLKFHSGLRKLDPVVCNREECPGKYARETIEDADPKRWYTLMRNKNFLVTDKGHIRIEGGLGLNPEKEGLKRATSPRH